MAEKKNPGDFSIDLHLQIKNIDIQITDSPHLTSFPEWLNCCGKSSPDENLPAWQVGDMLRLS